MNKGWKSGTVDIIDSAERLLRPVGGVAALLPRLHGVDIADSAERHLRQYGITGCSPCSQGVFIDRNDRVDRNDRDNPVGIAEESSPFGNGCGRMLAARHRGGIATQAEGTFLRDVWETTKTTGKNNLRPEPLTECLCPIVVLSCPGCFQFPSPRTWN